MRTTITSAAALRMLPVAGLLLAFGLQQAAAQEPVILPVLLRLEGVGTIYGAAGGVRNLSGERMHFLGGAVNGDVTGQAAALVDIPIGAPWAGLSFFLGRVQQARLTTSYTRGTEDDQAVEQTLSGQGAFAIVTLSSSDDTQSYRAGVGRTTVVLGDFHDSGGNRISLPGAKLDDIETAHLLIDGTRRSVDNTARPRSGVVLGAGLQSQSGRIGQSDVLQLDVHASAYVPVSDRIVWAVHARSRDAHLLRREKAFDTPAEVAQELNADCTLAGNSGDQADCQALADNLAAFIAASNRYGTVTPLGGSPSLRAYRELRFRSAHTRLLATELRITLSGNWEGILFLERGQAADDLRDISQEPRDSSGLGLRYWIGEIPLRLETADGSEGRAWFFTAGLPW